MDKKINKGKFDPRGKKGILLGYSETAKGYRIWSDDMKKVIISRDVKFLKENEQKIEISDVFSEKTKDKTPIDTLEIILNDPKEDNPGIQREIVPENENREGSRRKRGRPRERRRNTSIVEERTILTRGRRKQLEDEGEKSNTTVGLAELSYLSEVPINVAMSSDNVEEWLEAMALEMKAILRKDTWILVDRPKKESVIGCRMTLRNKYNADGQLERRKARLVAQGFRQIPGIHFEQTFSPVARISSVRLICALSVRQDMKIRQFDITNAYLHGNIEEKIFMETPKRFREILQRIVEGEE